jgi:hypothetical protein
MPVVPNKPSVKKPTKPTAVAKSVVVPKEKKKPSQKQKLPHQSSVELECQNFHQQIV